METINTSTEECRADDEVPLSYDREKELKTFFDTKTGVKGVVDSGAKTLPKIFMRPPNELAEDLSIPRVSNPQPPLIDFEGIETEDGRDEIMKQVLSASEEWGIFHVVNHGIPSEVLEKMMKDCQKFHDQDGEVKKEYYTLDIMKPVVYSSNDDLYHSTFASWRDNLSVNYYYEPKDLPEICRDGVVDYLNHVLKIGDTVLELLSVGLGLSRGYLTEKMECNKEWFFFNNFYPVCPAPELTLGFHKHTDRSSITVLHADEVSGLQVFYENQWVDVQPVPGALTVNLGDLLQIITNDRLKSVYHRVTANGNKARMSSALFFMGVRSSPKLYGPIKELLSDENAAIYKDFTLLEYYEMVFTGLTTAHGPDYVKIGTEAKAKAEPEPEPEPEAEDEAEAEAEV